ncbi:MAG: DUF3307 domain-containing protein [Alphaproteobacteria bacterium]
MSHEVALALLGLLVFQFKHFVADFVLQTRYQFSNKGFYGHPGGLLHAGIHAVGSVLALLVLTRSPSLIGILIAVEFVIHYHTDWLKETIDRRMKWTYQNTGYWIVFGADQLVHQLTYLGLIAFLASGLTV